MFTIHRGTIWQKWHRWVGLHQGVVCLFRTVFKRSVLGILHSHAFKRMHLESEQHRPPSYRSFLQAVGGPDHSEAIRIGLLESGMWGVRSICRTIAFADVQLTHSLKNWLCSVQSFLNEPASHKCLKLTSRADVTRNWQISFSHAPWRHCALASHVVISINCRHSAGLWRLPRHHTWLTPFHSRRLTDRFHSSGKSPLNNLRPGPSRPARSMKQPHFCRRVRLSVSNVLPIGIRNVWYSGASSAIGGRQHRVMTAAAAIRRRRRRGAQRCGRSHVR